MSLIWYSKISYVLNIQAILKTTYVSKIYIFLFIKRFKIILNFLYPL